MPLIRASSDEAGSVPSACPRAVEAASLIDRVCVPTMVPTLLGERYLYYET